MLESLKSKNIWDKKYNKDNKYKNDKNKFYNKFVNNNKNKINEKYKIKILTNELLRREYSKNPKEIKITKRNGNNVEHQKKFIHSNYSSSSIYNISSIGGSLLKDNIKLKSQHSPDKKEHLFSFGSDLLIISLFIFLYRLI